MNIEIFDFNVKIGHTVGPVGNVTVLMAFGGRPTCTLIIMRLGLNCGVWCKIEVSCLYLQ